MSLNLKSANGKVHSWHQARTLPGFHDSSKLFLLLRMCPQPHQQLTSTHPTEHSQVPHLRLPKLLLPSPLLFFLFLFFLLLLLFFFFFFLLIETSGASMTCVQIPTRSPASWVTLDNPPSSLSFWFIHL